MRTSHVCIRLSILRLPSPVSSAAARPVSWRNSGPSSPAGSSAIGEMPAIASKRLTSAPRRDG